LRIAIAAVLAVVTGAASAADRHTYGANPKNLNTYLDRLVTAYPGVVKAYDAQSLILKDGTRLPLSDGRADKSFDELLDAPDIGDMFAFAYPAGASAAAPKLNVDPGRIRVELLFQALYGNCATGEVEGWMRSIAWVPGHGGGKVVISTAQGADKALEAVSRDLDRLPKSFTKYLVPSAGTYNCRSIAGTSRQSMHGYGVAIDLNTKYSAYWRWAKPGPDGLHKWTSRIPSEIVAIFEKHGFIWGGRWYHYDTMHFEYRPDLFGLKGAQ
jgi:hypothetical protein